MRFALHLLTLLLGLSATAQQAHNVRLLCNWSDSTNAPGNGAGQHWNDVWGFTMHGREYGVIGGTNGLHIIDVATCEERAFHPGLAQNVIHRDYKTYRNYLYAVCDEGFSSLQVFDLSYLPDSIHLVYDRSAELTRAHTIFIDTARARLYACSATSRAGVFYNLQIFSLQRPDSPEYVAGLKNAISTHAVYARNDTVWCSNAYEGFEIISTKNPTIAPIIGGLISYPDRGYNHSSWIGYDGIGVMADETFGKQVKVIDASDPEQVEVLSMFSPRGNDTLSIPHNPYLLGRSAIVSYYMDGLQIYDLTDPRHPVQTGYYNTYLGPRKQDYAGAWGAYPFLPSRKILVSDMQRGLFVLDATEALEVKSTANPVLYVTPNPVSSGEPLRVSLPDTWNGKLRLQIRDVTGRTLTDKLITRTDNAPLQVSLPLEWPGGVYLLQVSSPAGRLTSRIIKR
jgi:choice-of-anchor B domain-containing protein